MLIKNLGLFLLCWPFQRLLAQPLLLAGWDFQTTSGGGTEVLASPQTPSIFNANFGIGTLYLNGEYGSSLWSSTQRTAYAGSNINTSGTSFSISTAGLGSLGLLSGSGLNGNGKSVVFKIAMRNRQELNVTYSAQRSSTGFGQHLWEISYDLVQWNLVNLIQSGTSFGTLTSTFSNTGILQLNQLSYLNNRDTAYLRLTLDGSSSSSGNNRLDNLQMRAWPIEITSDTLRIPTNQALNNLTVTGGTLLVDAGATLTINGTLTVSGGTITNNGTIAYGAAGALVYGSSNRTVGAEWPGSNGPLNVTIGSGGVTLGVARTISATGKLTLNGVFVTGDNLTLASDANGTAVVIGGTNSDIIGNVTVQRFLPWSGANH
ncbi:MAG: hypothetical protein RLZZ121_927, partial [Bacteroidota bacterium]